MFFLVCVINPIRPGDFWYLKDPGRQICPHPLYMGVVGGRFQNWVGTSYLTEIDARQKDLWLAWGPQLIVWKSDFLSGFMRFVRVPPYENWAFWTNFYFSWENGEFFWGQTCCTLFHTKNEEKSQKISTCIRIHTRVYAITWWWGQICPPPGAYRVKGAWL